MFRFRNAENERSVRPAIQMTSMIDIMFINLLFFMALFVYFQFENELSVKVPQADQSKQGIRTGEIIVNIHSDGHVTVNRKTYDAPALERLMRQSASINPEQEVVIRADKDTRHEDVVKVLNMCAKTKIWNLSFSAIGDKE